MRKHNGFYVGQIFILSISLLTITSCSRLKGTEKIRENAKAISFSWDDVSHNFGEVVVGSSDHKLFKITNHLKTKLTRCSEVKLSDTENFKILSSTCAQDTLLPEQSCEIDIEARPVTAGLKSLTLTKSCGEKIVKSTKENMITMDARRVTMAWDLAGFNFGDQDVFTGSGSQIFTLNNSGDGVAKNCSAPQISDPINFSISVDTCGTSNLIGAGSCAVTVLSHPRSNGPKQATLTRSCTVGGSVSTTTNGIQVNGVGPTLAWDQNSYDFGEMEIGQGDQQITLNLTNSGTADATGCDPVMIDDTSNFYLINDYCGTNDLAQGASCAVELSTQVQYEGQQTVTVSRTCSYGGVASTTAHEIKFTGTQHQFTFNPSSVDFEYDLSPVTLTLTNS